MQTTQSGRKLLDGRYEIQAVLGGGGSAVVYLAHHHVLKRNVAIKVIRPDVFESDTELERYLREATIIASLNHPNIVTLHDVGKLSDGRPYMVMEHVNGHSLNRLLAADATLPIDTAIAVFEQCARALGHAHRNGIVHRDIKPGNILLRQRSTGYPRVKVADFGVASVATNSVTHQGAFIGTPMYMSPEQAQGQPVSAASDIYSLGVVMYRALSGNKPFDADGPIALAMCHVNDPVPSMIEAAPELQIPADLEAVVLKCLQKDPADRFHSAADLLDALADVQITFAPHLAGMSQESLDAAVRVGGDSPDMRVGPFTLPRVALGMLTATALMLGVALGWSARRPVVVPVPIAPAPVFIEVPAQGPAPDVVVEPAAEPVVPAPAPAPPVEVAPDPGPDAAEEPPDEDTGRALRARSRRGTRSLRSPPSDGGPPVDAPPLPDEATDPEGVWGG